MAISRRESKERQKKLNQGIAKRAKELNLPSDLIRYQIAFEGFWSESFNQDPMNGCSREVQLY